MIQIWKLRLRGVRKLAQYCPPSEPGNWNGNSGRPGPEPCVTCWAAGVLGAFPGLVLQVPENGRTH